MAITITINVIIMMAITIIHQMGRSKFDGIHRHHPSPYISIWPIIFRFFKKILWMKYIYIIHLIFKTIFKRATANVFGVFPKQTLNFAQKHNAIWPNLCNGIERAELNQSEASNFLIARIVLYWVYYMWLLCLHAECIIQ